MPALPQPLFDAVVAQILPYVQGEGERREWLTPQLSQEKIYARIRWDGPARPFAVHIVEILSHDQLTTALRRLPVGNEQRDSIESLCARVEAQKSPSADSSPDPLTAYRRSLIEKWSDPRYQLDKNFVRLHLIDVARSEQGLQIREQPTHFKDLSEALAAIPDAIVLLGTPGSGKTTLVRHLQLDDARTQLDTGGARVSFLISLSGYPLSPKPDEDMPDPRAWLAAQWRKRAPAGLPAFDDLLNAGHMLLLLDAINEIPNRGREDYAERVEKWRCFLRDDLPPGNRVVFTCRTLDYSIELSVKDDVTVRQVQIKPLTPEQIQEFLDKYAPEHAQTTWQAIKGDERQIELYSTPYFLKLLAEQVNAGGGVPKGRASLFTGFVRLALKREVNARTALFMRDDLLTPADRALLANPQPLRPHQLPEQGLLIPKLTALAFDMQRRQFAGDAFKVRLSKADAKSLLDAPQAEDIVAAGLELGFLDEDRATDEVLFFHQLLQEYFAARRLAREPDPSLVRHPWRASEISPSLEDVLAGPDNYEPLPGLPTTGWELTTQIAAEMAADPDAFVQGMAEVNLPLAGLCAATEAVRASDALKKRLRELLVARTLDEGAELRARIEAGEALGELGDPRFVRRVGPHGPYLMPPLVSVPAGDYPMGDDEGYADEQPAHTVPVAAFEIGQFPVTNAEYKCFVDAGGYDDERWWDTDAAKAWRSGASAVEGERRGWLLERKSLQMWTVEQMREQLPGRGFSPDDLEFLIWLRNMTDEAFDAWLEDVVKPRDRDRAPWFWDDPRFNRPAQPVVGVCWHEARAYCAWLSAQTGATFRLPTEAEWEAAARGTEGRRYAFGEDFDPSRCNTIEGRVRRTTPIGVYPLGATPALRASPAGEAPREGSPIYDLCGNAWEWTISLWGEDPQTPEYQYPYMERRADREAVTAPDTVLRVVRGGAWCDFRDLARASYRSGDNPDYRVNNGGFRVDRALFNPSGL